MSGHGGNDGDRVFWPRGLEVMSPGERVAALAKGWWRDGQFVVTRDGRCMFAPRLQLPNGKLAPGRRK